MSILTGIIYPIAITGVAQLVFPGNANGSLVRRGDAVVGSTLVGQEFTSPRYFWPRPSATNYNAMPSGGSNLGPTSRALKLQIEARRARLQQTPHESGQPVPWDMVLASASGLDPHISPQAARYQTTRIIMSRGLDSLGASTLRDFIVDHTEFPSFGILGEPRVNVLELNLALDSLELESR